MSTRYRHIEVSGSPREMGRQIGEAAREEIRGFAAIALERVNKTVPISRERAMDISRRSMDCAAAYAPDMLDELRGMSEGAGVSLDEMMLLQVRNQLCPEEDAGCTGFCRRSPAQRRGPGDCRAELGQRPRAGPLHDRADAPPGWQARADERHPSGPHCLHRLQRRWHGRLHEHPAGPQPPGWRPALLCRARHLRTDLAWRCGRRGAPGRPRHSRQCPPRHPAGAGRSRTHLGPRPRLARRRARRPHQPLLAPGTGADQPRFSRTD